MDARILVTDDEESVRFTLKTFLLEEGYKVDPLRTMTKP